MPGPNHLRIGTSAFTAAGWPGTFYPKGMSVREYLTFYATKFDTVEVDSTFYRSPKLTTVQVFRQLLEKRHQSSKEVIHSDKCRLIEIAELEQQRSKPLL